MAISVGARGLVGQVQKLVSLPNTSSQEYNAKNRWSIGPIVRAIVPIGVTLVRCKTRDWMVS